MEISINQKEIIIKRNKDKNLIIEEIDGKVIITEQKYVNILK